MHQRILAALCAGAMSFAIAVVPASAGTAATRPGGPAKPPLPGSTAAVAADTGGLFGASDPTYNGVLRQSSAILGLSAVGERVPAPAVQWLLRQQCADGSFAAYRSDTSAPCPKPDPTAFTGPDTNSTAAAILALRQVATGPAKKDPATRALNRAQAWLAGQQTPTGGWEWIAGLGPDSVSTSMAITALPPGERSVRGLRWLAQQVDQASGCGLRFQPETATDPLSTAWAFIATQGALPYEPLKGPRSAARCPDNREAVKATGAWLANALATGNGRIPSAYDPTVTDWNSTALGTLGMSQRNGSTRAMRLGLTALQANVDAYAGTGNSTDPTALGTLLMVAHATKANPRAFGGQDLIARLLATMQA